MVVCIYIYRWPVSFNANKKTWRSTLQLLPANLFYFLESDAACREEVRFSESFLACFLFWCSLYMCMAGFVDSWVLRCWVVFCTQKKLGDLATLTSQPILFSWEWCCLQSGSSVLWEFPYLFLVWFSLSMCMARFVDAWVLRCWVVFCTLLLLLCLL